MLLGAAPLTAQSVALNAGSTYAPLGGSFSIPLSLVLTGSANPASIQWTLHYPAGAISNVVVTPWSSVSAAGKSLVCSSSSSADTTCLLFGLNSTSLAPGAFATITASVPLATANATIPIRVGEVIAVANDGSALAGAASTPGSVSVAPIPLLSSLDCPVSLQAPGTDFCTVTLASSFPLPVDLSLRADSPLVFVPQRLRFPPGTTQLTFALAASGSSGRSVQVSADTASSHLQVPVLVNGGNDSVLLLNAASFSPDSICSPGSVVTAFGPSLASQTASAPAGPLPTDLGGVEIQAGDLAPLIFVSPTQVNFQCPQLTDGQQAQIVLQNENGPKPPVTVVSQPVSPGLYALGPLGSGQAAALIAGTGQLAVPNGGKFSGRPAKPGEYLELYGNGFGLTTPAWPVGTPAPVDQLLWTVNAIAVVVGDIELIPAFVGLAPGRVGLYQIDVMLPLFLSGGNAVPVYAKVYLPDGRILLSNTVTVAVDSPSQGIQGFNLTASPGSLSSAGSAGTVPPSQPIRIDNSGFGNVHWSASADSPWISLTPPSGTAPAVLNVSLDPSALAAGIYQGKITLTPNEDPARVLQIPVSFRVSSLLFSDTFATGASNWTISPLGNAGGWSVVNGVYRYNGSGATEAWTGNAAWKDYSLSTDFRLDSLKDYPGGIRARLNPATGAGYGAWLYPAEGVIKLFRISQWNIDAGNKLLAQAPAKIAAGTWQTLTVNLQGSTIEVYLGGALVLRTTDSTYTQGAIALDVSNQPISFTNISVIGQ